MFGVRKWVAATVLSGGLALGAAGPAVMSSPAGAQQQGLVNIEITNVLNNNTVTAQIPITAAANICGVNVGVLSSLPVGQTFNCTATARGVNTVEVTRLPPPA
jgi:hypothetical protein